MKRNILGFFCLSMGLLVLIAGCDALGLGGGFKIKGTFAGMKMKMKGVHTYSVASTLGADKVCAIPVSKRGSVWPINTDITKTKLYDLSADGAFNVSVGESGFGWIYLLIDSTQPKTNQVVGFLSLGDASDSLIAIPTENVVASIDCGSVEMTNDEARGANGIVGNGASFSLSTAQLREIAKIDNALKCVKNNYINYDASTGGFITYIPRYNWTTTNKAMLGGNYTDPAQLGFKGMTPQFDTSDADIMPAKLADGSVLLEFYPPSAITFGVNTYSPSAPLSTKGGKLDAATGKFSSDESFCQYEKTISTFTFNGNTGGTDKAVQYFTNSPAGLWIIKKNGVAIGYVDMALAAPVDSKKICTLFIPSIKITVANGIVTKIDVKFYTYNNGQYVELTDLTAFEKLASAYQISIYSAGKSDVYIYPSVTDASGITYSTDLSSYAMTTNALLISIQYTVGGINFNFNH